MRTLPLLRLSLIEFVQLGVYKVSFFAEGKAKITTTCRLEDRESHDVANFPVINFDSDEVGKSFMRGELDMRLVCSAIAAFHRAQQGNAQ